MPTVDDITDPERDDSVPGIVPLTDVNPNPAIVYDDEDEENEDDWELP